MYTLSGLWLWLPIATMTSRKSPYSSSIILKSVTLWWNGVQRTFPTFSPIRTYLRWCTALFQEVEREAGLRGGVASQDESSYAGPPAEGTPRLPMTVCWTWSAAKEPAKRDRIILSELFFFLWQAKEPEQRKKSLLRTFWKQNSRDEVLTMINVNWDVFLGFFSSVCNAIYVNGKMKTQKTTVFIQSYK